MTANQARKRVLITGAAGRIGASLAEQLRDRYDLRLQYHRTIPEQPPVADHRGNTERHHDGEERESGDERRRRELLALQVQAGAEEVERDEERREDIDRVQHLFGRHCGHVLAEALRHDPDDERADEVVGAKLPRGKGRTHRHHHEKGELRARRDGRVG